MQPSVVVVGAGPAGLASAATLRQRGIEATLLERSDQIGSSWRNRYDSLHLHTARWLSGLPGAGIPRQYGRWVARDDVVSYLEDYVRRFGLEPQFGVTVDRIERASQGWRVHTSTGLCEADAVVIATGYSHTPSVPDWPGLADFERPLLHSSAYRSPYGFRGQHVLVVGAGNSGTEIATELVAVADRVTLSLRKAPNIVRRSSLGVPTQAVAVAMKRIPERALNPMSAVLRRATVPDLTPYGLPAPKAAYSQFEHSRTIPVVDHGFVRQVRSGRIRIVSAVEGLDRTSVLFVDGGTADVDAVIVATGYTTGLDGMVGHLGVLDARGVPLVTGAETLPTAPGLHFVGVIVKLSGVLYEIGLEARAVARALADG